MWVFLFTKSAGFIYKAKDNSMVYLNNISQAQTAMIPTNGEVASGTMILALRNTTDLTEHNINVTRVSATSQYVKVTLAIPENLPDGEYHYIFKCDGILVSSGLLYLGNLMSPNQYAHEINYKQYGTTED